MKRKIGYDDKILDADLLNRRYENVGNLSSAYSKV